MEKPDGAEDVKRFYLEQWGSALVTNTYLLVTVVGLILLLAAQTWLLFRVHNGANERRPLVIRIDEVGRAAAVNYQSFEYAPQDRELRYFLNEFVTKHFSRIPATLRARYTDSLYFLDSRLSQALIDEERKNHTLDKFISEGTEELDIEVKNVGLAELRTPPYKATVDFERVHYTRSDRREVRREKLSGTFEFIVRKDVPNALIPVNPLGLTITYYRVDEAFR